MSVERVQISLQLSDEPNPTWSQQVLAFAVAETCYLQQVAYLDLVLAIIKAAQGCGRWRPVAFLWKTKFDETRLLMKAAFAGWAASQAYRCYVVECGWACLVQDMTKEAPEGDPGAGYFLIHSDMAPQVRVADSGTGEALVAVLASTGRPPDTVKDTFPRLLRVTECDSAGSNFRGERLLQKLPLWRPWLRFVQPCLAHRVHQAACRTVDLQPKLMSSITRTALYLADHLPLFRSALEAILRDKFVVVNRAPDLDRDQQAFRRRTLQLFSPDRGHSTKLWLSLVSQGIFNGDWRESHRISHYCQGCCRDADHALHKAISTCMRIVRTAAPCPFNKANWQAWRRCRCYIGLLGGIHNLLFQALRSMLGMASLTPGEANEPVDIGDDAIHGLAQGGEEFHADENAFGQQDEAPQRLPEAGLEHVQDGPQQPPPDQPLDDDVEGMVDEMARRRRDMAKHKQVAAEFASSWMPWQRCFGLFQALAPQSKLMDDLLEVASVHRHLKEKAQAIDRGATRLPMLIITDTINGPFAQFLAACMQQLADPSSWDHLVPSQLLSSTIVIAGLRCAAIVYTTCIAPCSEFPLKLFSLCREGPLALTCQDFADTPACRLDAFSLEFRNQFPTREALESEEARQVLLTLIASTDGNCQSVERLHSRNLHQAKGRSSTHRVDVAWLGAVHQRAAGPPWVQAHFRDLAQRTAPRIRQRSTVQKRKRSRSDPVHQHDLAQCNLHGQANAENAQDANNQQRLRKRRPGAGGAWRAFLHVQGRGVQSRDLAQAYRELDEEERSYYQTLGRQGTAAYRHGIRAFGVAGAQMAAAQRGPAERAAALDVNADMQDVRDAPEHPLPPLHLSLEDWHADFEVLFTLSRQRQQQQAGRSALSAQEVLEEVALPLISWTQPLEAVALEGVVRLCTRVARKLRKELAASEAGRASQSHVLQDFSARRLPTLSQQVPHTKGIDHVTYPNFCTSISSQIPCTACLPTESFKQKSSSWEERHTGLLAKQFAHLVPHPPQRLTGCRVAGQCVCRGAGRLLRLAVSKCDGVTKLLCQTHKAKLISGNVVLCFAVSDNNGADICEAPAPASASAADGAVSRDTYAHVSFLSLKPYKLVYTLLQRCSNTTFKVLVDVERQQPCLRTQYELLGELDLRLSWSLRAIEVETEADNACYDGVGCCIEVKGTIRDAECFWRGSAAEAVPPQQPHLPQAMDEWLDLEILRIEQAEQREVEEFEAEPNIEIDNENADDENEARCAP